LANEGELLRLIIEMIKHIVMWTVTGQTKEERADAIHKVKSAFNGIVGIVPGLVKVEVGVDISRIDYACDVVLYSEFESKAALENYATHPAHLKIKEDLTGVRVGRYQVDYVVEQAA
jgi:hypothetical protein